MHLLAQVSVENDAAAESLYGETLPGTRKMLRISVNLVSDPIRCFNWLLPFFP